MTKDTLEPVDEIKKDVLLTIEDGSGNQVSTTVDNVMESMLMAADVGAVYGEPVQHGETVIVPAAEVLAAAGFGIGASEAKGASDGGGGGGGRVLSRPVAVVIASPDGVRVEPVVDVTKIALATLTTFGMMIGMYRRMRRQG